MEVKKAFCYKKAHKKIYCLYGGDELRWITKIVAMGIGLEDEIFQTNGNR
ncbi:MAG: hypothetical protein Crog4KO_06500 [Crocinitomicaceae bacterium]